MAKIDRLNFKTHAELKNVIGQDLINDDNIAVIELVKNSLDANSRRVDISFCNVPNGQDGTPPLIVIADSGVGMSRADIADKWLNIAYSEKKGASNAGRRFAGNKGVGRFACDRLGRRLDMYTRKRGERMLWLEVCWTDFENKQSSDSSINNIDLRLTELTDLEYQKRTGLKPFAHGTSLTITDLRSEWDLPRLLTLRRNLERFVDPRAAFDSAGVTITLSVPSLATRDKKETAEHQKVNGTISNRVFEKLKFKTTYIVCEFKEETSLVTTELFHDGERVYRIVERNPFNLIPDATIVIHYMNPYKKAYFKRQTGLNSVEFGSIFLFLNGYRISPYGDRDDDWLQLDSRKGQAFARTLGNRELVGRVEVDDDDGRLRVVSNREGVARNATFAQLTDRDGAFYFALRRLERFVVDGLNWDSVPEVERRALEAGHLPGDKGRAPGEIYEESAEKKQRYVSLNLLKLIGASAATTVELDVDTKLVETLGKERDEEVRTILGKFRDFGAAIDQSTSKALSKVAAQFERQAKQLDESRRTVSRKERQLERAIGAARQAVTTAKDLQTKVKTQESELLFARLASGTDKETLMLLHHQNTIYANTAKNYLDRAIAATNAGDKKKAIEAIEKAMFSTRRILAVTSFATKANFRMKTDTLTEDVATFVQEYVGNVARDIAATNLAVTVKNDSGGPFKMRFKPIDLAIVFDNLASNSTRAKARKFEVLLSRAGENELIIRVRDDGPGLSKQINPPEAVFQAGVTTTSGSGLGLFHVKQTIEQLGGQVSLDAGNTGGFGVAIRLFK